MDRRTYLATTLGLGAASLTGCTGYFGPNATGTDTGSPAETQTGDSPDTQTQLPPDTLSAGSYTVTVTNPRVRASIRKAGVHVDVHAEQGSQFLLLDAETDGSRVEELPLSVVAASGPITDRPSLVGRPAAKTAGVIAFPVPVSKYETVEVLLEADSESTSWQVPDGVVETLATAPDFTVSDIVVPETVRSGESFKALFAVANEGDRDARFLAEFGHTLLSDTGEVAVTVPAGERRTHTSTIEPYYDDSPAEIPMILDWGIQARHASVAVEPQADFPPRSDALSIESSYPIDGTMVNVGVGGTARNTSETPLTDCVIVASGDVGGHRFSATTRRDQLDPDQTWEWEVSFGDVADAQREPVQDIDIETRADSSG